jgi:hypothetical protein
VIHVTLRNESEEEGAAGLKPLKRGAWKCALLVAAYRRDLLLE